MLKNHRQIVEEHFNRCLKEHGLTPQEAISIAKKPRNHDQRLVSALRSFAFNNLYTVDILTLRSLLPVGFEKINKIISL